MRGRALLSGLALAAGLAACEEAEPVARAAPPGPEYLGIETRLLDGDLVNFHVALRRVQAEKDVESYAECAAAQYALIRGYGFARHVRTNVYEEGGIWRADAVYTISPALPEGLRTIDAEVTVASCQDRGIPTV